MLRKANFASNLFLRIGLLALVVCGPASASVILSINPVTQLVAIGSNTQVTVNISGVTDLFSLQFDFFFSPATVHADSISEGMFLASGGNSTDFFAGTIDNINGSIATTFNTAFGAGPGVDGSGILAYVNFLAIAPGTAFLSLDNIILDDSQGNAINFNAPLTSTILTSINGVPEPATVFLTMTGVGLVLWRKRGGFLRSILRDQF